MTQIRQIYTVKNRVNTV